VAEQPDRLNWTVEVNLSDQSIGDAGLPNFIASSISRAGIDPGNLIFEITETAAIANIDLSHHLAQSLRNIGCRFALDHFMAGFKSLVHLNKAAIDDLEIDGQVVNEWVTTPGELLLIDGRPPPRQQVLG
jgi:EAL domain-containing protein (putative c-di-GMP-specific phosphodiesterase class I)